MVWVQGTEVRSFRFLIQLNIDYGLQDDSIGGQLYYSAGLSTISDLPFKAHWPLKMHAWVNAGRLDEVDQSLLLSITRSTSLSIDIENF